MTCAEVRNRIDAYARGALPAEEAAAFESHLTTCAACTEVLEAAEPSLEAIRALPARVEPAADLWPGIRARIARGRGRIAMPAWLLAAAAVLLIVGSSTVTALLIHHPSSRPAVQPSQGLSPLEAQYASATSDLTAALDQARGRLTPSTIAIIERNLAVIDRALAESRRALASDPGNATLERLVIAAWRQKVDFLRRAAALSTES